jgi:hypothetical protein
LVRNPRPEIRNSRRSQIRFPDDAPDMRDVTDDVMPDVDTTANPLKTSPSGRQ